MVAWPGFSLTHFEIFVIIDFVLLVDLSKHFAGIPGGNYVCRDILRDNTSCTNDSILPTRHFYPPNPPKGQAISCWGKMRDTDREHKANFNLTPVDDYKIIVVNKAKSARILRRTWENQRETEESPIESLEKRPLV